MLLSILALEAAALAAPAATPPPAPGATIVAQPAPAPVDPARLAIARRVVAKMLAPGRVASIMALVMTKMFEGMDAQKNRIAVIKLLPMMNAPLDAANRISPENIGKIAAILDPAADKRDAIAKRITVAWGSAIGTKFEPDMREAMALAYARRFDATVLSDVERFVSTPSGATYAAAAMTMTEDPAMVALNTRVQNYIGQQATDLMKQIIAQVADLPPARSFGDLTQAERMRIAELAGIKPEK